MDNILDDIVNIIKESREYTDCINIKEILKDNKEVNSKIKRIKLLQKKYLRTNDIEVEKELKELEKELNNIPIYCIYNQKLEKVNQMISYVNDELNDYFYNLLNKNY